MNGARDTLHGMCGPGSLQGVRPSFAVAQKKSCEPSARALLIALGSFPCTNQITQSFVSSVGHPAGSEIARSITASQLQCITSVSLNFVAGLNRNQRGCNHVAVNAERGELPVEHVSGRTSFVTGAELFRRSELLHAAADGLFAVGNHSDGANFTIGFSNGNGNRVSVDIQTNKSYCFHGPTHPFVC